MTLFRYVAMVVVACLLTSTVAVAVPPSAPLIAPPSPSTEVAPPVVQQRAAYGQLPLAFEENRGQTHPTVRFLARGAGYTAFLTATETVLVLAPAGPQSDPLRRHRSLIERRGDLVTAPAADAQGPAVVRMSLAGANPAPRLAGQRSLPGVANYFIGRDPSRWRTNVPTYASVGVDDVYPGIGMVYYGNGRELEYDFVVAPGADPGQVRLVFEGVDSLRVDGRGDLVLAVAGRELRMREPVTHQTIAGVRRTIASRYTIVPAATSAARPQVTFAVGAYDRAHSLVIDPVVAYTAVLGGTQYDSIDGLAADAAGNAYLTGQTYSAEFPVVGGIQSRLIGTPGTDADVFVAKLNPSGTALLYSTYLGGAGIDGGTGIAVDAAGNAYVTGQTTSGDFPVTVGAFQTGLLGSSDAFVTKLNATGSALTYSTYLGGRGFEQGTAVTVNGAGNAHVVGVTNSFDFPVAGTPGPAFGVVLSLSSAFVAKLLPDGSGLVYGTYLGNADFSGGTGIALDGPGNAWVVGNTRDESFPLLRPIQDDMISDGQSNAAFITQLDPSGVLRYSTFLSGTVSGVGGTRDTHATAVAVDRDGNVHVTGSTRDADFPTLNAFQTALGAAAAENAFVLKLNPSGALLYSTYLGGRSTDLAQSIAIGPSGSAWVVGATDSLDFPKTPPAVLTEAYGFVSRISPTGALLFSMPVRARPLAEGPNNVFLRAVALDPAGRVYFGGEARGVYQPAPTGPLPQPQNVNPANAVMTALVPLPELMTTALSVSASTASPGGKLSATFTIQNQGETRAPATTARIYLRVGMQPRALVGQAPVGALAQFQSLSSTSAFTVPKTTGAGLATIEVCANDPSGTAEEISTNNCRSSATVRIMRPDLVVNNITVQALEISAGGSLLVQTTTANVGDAPAPPSTLRYYFAGFQANRSPDDVRASTQAPVGALAPGASAIQRVPIDVPLTLRPGPYWIIACADDLGVDPEASETNNCQATEVTIRVLAVTLPDLWISSLGPSEPATIGQSISVTTNVFNIGNRPAAASILRYYFSRFPHRSAAEVRSATVLPIPPLNPDEVISQTPQVAVPGTLTAGGHYIIACVDDLRVVPESDEDNCAESARIQVIAPGVMSVVKLPQVIPSAPGPSRAVPRSTTVALPAPAMSPPPSVIVYPTWGRFDLDPAADTDAPLFWEGDQEWVDTGGGADPMN